jgi:hypothetical protein
MRFQYTPFYAESGKPMTYPAENGETLSRSEFIALATTQPRSFDIIEGMARLLPDTLDYWQIDKYCTEMYDTERKNNPFACIHRKKKSCPVDCDNCRKTDCHRSDNGLKCTRKCECCKSYCSKTIELDNTFGKDSVYEIAADLNIEQKAEDKLMLDRLLETLEVHLEDWERRLILDVYGKKKTVRELAADYGWKNQSTVNHHRERIERLLRKKI